jgi:flagellar hook-length control protein FliK
MSSRVDEEREIAKEIERQALKKREEEARAKGNKEAAQTFAKKLKQSNLESTRFSTQMKEAEGNARGAIAKMLEKQESLANADKMLRGEKSIAKDLDARGFKNTEEKSTRESTGQLNRTLKDKVTSENESANSAANAEHGKQADESRSTDARGDAQRADGRHSDAKSEYEKIAERKEQAENAAGNKPSAGASSGSGELKTEGDKGGSSGGSDKGDDQKGSEAPPGFRFNPALMAPVPVQQAKQTGGSEKLRALANEIAQKIVERVRVGTNAAGKAEFQIDLRSNVLSGLSIKVSSSNGRISAKFMASDKEVLKLLRDQSDSLKQALTGRGLTLDELKIEERA